MRDRLNRWWQCHPTTAAWIPAVVLKVDVIRLSWLLLALAAVRGLDYATGRDTVLSVVAPTPGYTPGSPLVGIEAAFPLWVWATALLGWSVVLAAGMLFRWHVVVWVAHVMLAALYAGLSVGLIYGYLERPFFDGIRNGVVVLLPAALHTLLWWRMGPVPDDQDRCDDGVPA